MGYYMSMTSAFQMKAARFQEMKEKFEELWGLETMSVRRYPLDNENITVEIDAEGGNAPSDTAEAIANIIAAYADGDTTATGMRDEGGNNEEDLPFAIKIHNGSWSWEEVSDFDDEKY